MQFDLIEFILVGFAAQLVDGALGMAFGVISSTLLVSLGVPPARASAGVHAVETITTGVSGLSHAIAGNVDWRLFAKIVVPGIFGGILGAYALSNMPASAAKPVVLTYLTIIGLVLVWRGLRYPPPAKKPKVVAPLGLAGGFLDAAGGGGWGAIVTGNLLMQGAAPRHVVGTVNLAEFFVTLTISGTFLLTLGPDFLTKATVGLLIGGVLAAPLGAVMAKRVPTKPLLILVGMVLVVTSFLGLARALT